MRIAFDRFLFCLLALTSLFLNSAASTVHAIEPTGPIEKLADGFAFTEGPAATDDGTLYFTDIPNNKIHRLSADGKISVFTDTSNHANGLWMLGDNKMLACEMDGAVVRYDLGSGAREVLTDSFEGKRYNACNDMVVDQHGGIYFTDPQYRAPTPLPQEVRSVYYRSADGDIARMTGDLAAPNGIGLSLDGKTLYVIPSMQADMLAFDVQTPGKITNQRVLCTLAQPDGETSTGGDGMAMDSTGNLYITTHLGVQIFTPEGTAIGLVTFPEHPANVTFMGPGFRTLVVTARTSLYSVRMPIAGSRLGMNSAKMISTVKP